MVVGLGSELFQPTQDSFRVRKSSPYPVRRGYRAGLDWVIRGVGQCGSIIRGSLKAAGQISVVVSSASIYPALSRVEFRTQILRVIISKVILY